MLKISFTKGIKVLKHLAKSKIIDKVWEDFNPYGFSDYQTRRIKRVFYSNLWQKEIKQVDYNSQTDIENFTFNTRFIDAEHALIIYRHMIKKIFTNNLRIFWSILGQYFNILAGDVSFVPKKEAKFLQKITSPITFGTISKYWSKLIIIKKNDPELTELYKNWLVKNQEFFNPQDSETLENVIPALSPEENKDIYTYFFNACEPPKLNVKHVVPIAIKYLQNQYEKDANVKAKCLDILFDLMPIGSLEFQKEFLQYIKDNYINEQYSQMNLPFILAGYFLKKYPNPGFTAEEFDIKSIFENKKQQELEEEIKVQEILKLLKF